MPGYNDALKEVSSILERMGTNAPLAAFERIKSLMLQNQPIFNQICDIIESLIINEWILEYFQPFFKPHKITNYIQNHQIFRFTFTCFAKSLKFN